jgi:hypothetical protein
MPYDHQAVMTRDGRSCRLRFPGCRNRARRIILSTPEYLGGPSTDANALAACDHCADTQLHQRERAAELFGYSEGR